MIFELFLWMVLARPGAYIATCLHVRHMINFQYTELLAIRLNLHAMVPDRNARQATLVLSGSTPRTLT